jgi:hypothetical protein
MNGYRAGLLAVLAIVLFVICAASLWRAGGLRRSWVEITLATLGFLCVLPFVLFTEQWLSPFNQRDNERVFYVRIEMGALANNSIVVQPNEYVSLIVGEPGGLKDSVEYNNLHVVRTLDSDGKNAAYGSTLATSILLEIPESYASGIMAALKNKDKIPIYLYRQGLAIVTPAIITPPSSNPPATPSAGATATSLPPNLATFSLPMNKIVTDVSELQKYQDAEIRVIMVVQQKIHEQIRHEGHTFNARLLRFIDVSGNPVPTDRLRESAIQIAIERDAQDRVASEFAAQLVDVSTIHILAGKTSR